MDIFFKKGGVTQETEELIVLGVFEGKTMFEETEATKLLDELMDGSFKTVAKEDGFLGKMGQVMWQRTQNKRVLLIGLGGAPESSGQMARWFSAMAMQSTANTTYTSVALFLPPLSEKAFAEIGQAMVEGIRLATYSFAKYKVQKNRSLTQVGIYFEDGAAVTAAKRGQKIGESVALGVLLARDLVNTPGMHMHPAELVAVARAVVKDVSGFTVVVHRKPALERMGAGGILGVAQGSLHEPFLVHMTYKPAKATKKRVAIVGKGVTFDSGGLSLKPADYMMTMKCDMAGAANVIGLFKVLTQLRPSVEVHGIFAAVENMPSGEAIRPGDVLTMMNKKTVEVLNTDAEGRLILADALVYAAKLKPARMIDLATLTGACVVALGEEVSGLMSNNRELAGELLGAAKSAGEKIWELPLESGYKKLFAGDIADLKNIGGRYGGALTAGLFLQEFVAKDIAWAHMDIAGPAFAERDISPFERKGATGHGVRTLVRWLQALT